MRSPEALRAARRRWYDKNKEVEKRKIKERTKQYRKRNLYYARDRKKVPCVDCGQSFIPFVMQFDHVKDDKAADVSRLVARPVSLEKLATEIEKCEVVCSNCHALRTWERRMSTLPQELRDEAEVAGWSPKPPTTGFDS